MDGKNWEIGMTSDILLQDAANPFSLSPFFNREPETHQRRPTRHPRRVDMVHGDQAPAICCFWSLILNIRRSTHGRFCSFAILSG
ncbi:unnamed protein product [Cuscuta campestris]|uniref:Uncharacterized protein n=1 Tax=Cuscuta campestris TaxID=132261 RepID=A0A484MCM8_9ASTE|nr:unnamed protein product [Cuscuta campestris]